MAKRKQATTKRSARSQAKGGRSRAKTVRSRRPARVSKSVRDDVKAEHADLMGEIRALAEARGLAVTEVHFVPATRATGALRARRASGCPPGQVRVMVRVRDEHGTLIAQPKCVKR